MKRILGFEKLKHLKLQREKEKEVSGWVDRSQQKMGDIVIQEH